MTIRLRVPIEIPTPRPALLAVLSPVLVGGEVGVVRDVVLEMAVEEGDHDDDAGLAV